MNRKIVVAIILTIPYMPDAKSVTFVSPIPMELKISGA
jgi:hypothetical protein